MNVFSSKNIRLVNHFNQLYQRFFNRFGSIVPIVNTQLL